MENKNLRNVLMAAGLAVFAGVLTLGVNAAFGLDVPSQDPAGAALHSPVFKDVNVENDVNAGNNLYVGKNIQAGENITVGGLVLTTNATGDIINQDQDSPVVIDDNLNVTGVADITKHLVVRQDIDVSGLINNSSDKNAGAVVIDDINGLKVSSGTATFDNDTNLNGNLTVGFKNPEVLRNVTLNANTTTKGSLSVGTGLTAKSFIDALGGIKNSKVVVEGGSNVPKPVNIDDDLQVTGNGIINGNTFANQGLTVNGLTSLGANLVVTNGISNAMISVGGAAGFGSLLITPDTISNFSKALILQNGKGFPVQIGNAAKNSNLNVFGEVTASTLKTSSDIQVDGGRILVPNASLEIRDTGGNKFFKIINGSLIQSSTDSIQIDDKLFVSGDVDLGTSNNSKDINLMGTVRGKWQGDLDISDNVNVTGHLKASSGIGAYTSVNSAMIAVDGGNSGEASIACPANYKIISCQPRSSDNINFNSWTQWIYINYANADLSNNTCYVRGKNGLGAVNTRYVGATATCFNANL